eukprot:c25061_g1_i2 orf=483-770(-)
MPRRYIYEPWTAPTDVQKKAGCILGKDYPKPIVDHKIASKQCRDRMGASYALNKEAAGKPSCAQLDYLNRKLKEREIQGQNEGRKKQRQNKFTKY